MKTKIADILNIINKGIKELESIGECQKCGKNAKIVNFDPYNIDVMEERILCIYCDVCYKESSDDI